MRGEMSFQRAADDTAEGANPESVFTYLVTVDTDTREHADEVMRERIGHDEDLGFEYTIDWRAQ